MAGGMKFTGGGENDVKQGRNYDTAPAQPRWGNGSEVTSPGGANIPAGSNPGGDVANKSYDSQGTLPRGGKQFVSPADTITY